MTPKAIALSGAAALAILALCGSAVGQPARPAAPAAAAPARPAAPAAPAIAHGPPIAGICVISTQEVLATSAVGKAVEQRMDMLKNQVNAELQGQATALGNEQRTLQGSAAGQDPTKVAAFQLKASEFQKLRDQRVQELEATQQKALQRVLQELQPVVQQAYQQKQCSILLERDNGVMAVNPAMDLTPAAITGLNGKIQTITFDRERLEAQPAGTAPTPGR